MRILITGANGRLGGQLVQQLQHQHTITGIDLEATDSVLAVNITDKGAVDQVFDHVQPEMVLHCAALTNVDYCAENPDAALNSNAFGTQLIALACQRHEATLLYVSTNEVFDGSAKQPYLEYDRPQPANAYGYSKWVGEQVVRDLVAKHYIVRPSWLFAHGGHNFVQTILRLAAAGKSLRVVTNEIACPTYNNDLVTAIEQLIATECYGIYHLVNEGATSRYAFARQVLDLAGDSDVALEPISLAEYGRASRPPEYGALRNMAAARLGITLRPWQEALTAFMAVEGLLVS
ncbi:MAG: dTDP-4-dehydrorhamnose reductase [Anaerolineae bacterium]|nr:dTDP-4-dehydrorhamnose reductase [Anaerolineae bacterium]